MEKKLITRYRLALVINSGDKNVMFSIVLADHSAHNYGPDYRDEEEFDTEEEAIAHAMNSEKWADVSFTILPIYRVVNEI